MNFLSLLIAFCLLICVNSFFFKRSIGTISQNRRFSSKPNNFAGDVVQKKIQSIISSNKVVLFMKGNKLYPSCGFSNSACRLLDSLRTPYETVDVLKDDDIRSGIKVYSSWPTIPQLYIGGEFIGGADIMLQLYESGELGKLLQAVPETSQ